MKTKENLIYRVIYRKDEEYQFNVQIITNGYYCGFGRFCKSIKEVVQFIQKDLKEVAEIMKKKKEAKTL